LHPAMTTYGRLHCSGERHERSSGSRTENLPKQSCPPESPTMQELAVQRILQRNQRVFLGFVGCALLVCALILLAIFAKARL